MPTSCWAGSIPATSPAARSSSRPSKAGAAVDKAVGTPLGLKRLDAAFGVSEIVEENMANAARVHAVERGKELQDRTMIAFGGAAPHPCRAAGREARHQPRHGADRRGRRLGGRLPDGAGRLRGRAQPLRAARRRQVRSGLRQRAVRRDARRGRGRGEGRRARRQAGRDAHRRHALSRPGPRDHRRPAGRRRSPPPRATSWSKLYEEGYAATFGRTIPGLERRDHELDAAARRRAAADAQGAAAARRHAGQGARPARRSTIRPIRT